MSGEFNRIESLAEQLKAYVNTRLSQAKLLMAEKVSRLAATMIALLLAALLFFLFIVLLSVAAAIAIGEWLGNAWLGFLITSGLVLLLGILVWAAKDRLLRIPIMNKLIETLFDPEDEDEKDQTP